MGEKKGELMGLEDVKSLLIDFVNRNSNVPGLQWDQSMRMRLPFDPYTKSYSGRRRLAHYFLLVGSITETELVGRAERSRALMINVHRFLGDSCFRENRVDRFREIIRRSGFLEHLGVSKDQIPETLVSVNSFVQDVCEGDLVGFAGRLSRPEELVTKIGENVARMGGRYAEKAWMYMRWMTRPYPDLGIFGNFSPRDLYVPMTSCIRDVASCLGLCSDLTPGWWNDCEKVAQARDRLTEFARELFPEDPAKIDYPFYILGRCLRGKNLSLNLLEDHLRFWGTVWDKTRVTPVTFDMVSREETLFEKGIKSRLEELKILFYYEPFSFGLPKGSGAPKYTPDFILPRCKRKGRTVILEPHGIWTRLQKRLVRIGKKRFSLWVDPTRIEPSELEFVNKLWRFRDAGWRRKYYLILIVPPQFKGRISKSYPTIADEIWDAKDLPRLIYDLKTNSHQSKNR